MKAVKVIYSIISAVMIIALVSVTLFALLLGISGMDKQNPKSVFGFRSFIVLSDSMSPTFNAGSVIIVQETPAEKLQKDDIITYRPLGGDGDTLLTHRIVEVINEDGRTAFITRGDANNTNDPNEVEAGVILGKTVLHINGAGTFIQNLRTPAGLVLMILAILIVLFILPYIINKFGAKTKSDMPEKTEEPSEIISEVIETAKIDEAVELGENSTADVAEEEPVKKTEAEVDADEKQ